jgi:hypothetical protein
MHFFYVHEECKSFGVERMYVKRRRAFFVTEISHNLMLGMKRRRR